MIIAKLQMAYFGYVEEEHTQTSPLSGKGSQEFFFYHDLMEIN